MLQYRRYRDSCKLYRDTNCVTSIVIHRCIDESMPTLIVCTRTETLHCIERNKGIRPYFLSLCLSGALILTTNLAACVCVCAKFYQFPPLRSYFVSKRPENFVRIAKFPYAAFGPLFAFHCPLFFTRNNDLGCKSSRSAVVVSPVCGR